MASARKQWILDGSYINELTASMIVCPRPARPEAKPNLENCRRGHEVPPLGKDLQLVVDGRERIHFPYGCDPWLAEQARVKCPTSKSIWAAEIGLDRLKKEHRIWWIGEGEVWEVFGKWGEYDHKHTI